MIQKLRIENVALEETYYMSVELSSEASFADMIQAAGLANGDLSPYYQYSGALAFNDPYLPFVISNKHVLFDVPYENVKAEDFIETFNLFGKEIFIKTGYAQAGGPGICDLKQMWESAYPILEQIAVGCTITGLSLSTLTKLVKWFCSLFRRRKRKPQTCFDIIYCKRTWNHLELAELLEIDSKRAKELLNVFGYIYDRHKMLYIESENIEEIKEKLQYVKGIDC